MTTKIGVHDQDGNISRTGTNVDFKGRSSGLCTFNRHLLSEHFYAQRWVPEFLLKPHITKDKNIKSDRHT